MKKIIPLLIFLISASFATKAQSGINPNITCLTCNNLNSKIDCYKVPASIFSGINPTMDVIFKSVQMNLNDFKVTKDDITNLVITQDSSFLEEKNYFIIKPDDSDNIYGMIVCLSKTGANYQLGAVNPNSKLPEKPYFLVFKPRNKPKRFVTFKT